MCGKESCGPFSWGYAYVVFFDLLEHEMGFSLLSRSKENPISSSIPPIFLPNPIPLKKDSPKQPTNPISFTLHIPSVTFHNGESSQDQAVELKEWEAEVEEMVLLYNH